jgi:hypothetical protein
MSLFLFIFSYFLQHTYTFIQSHYSVTVRRDISPSPHRLSAQWEKPPCDAEPRIEFGPAPQQADALPTEPRRSIN